ncbi:DUF3519 domain-containing protein [Campylobacter jejuni]|uniref:putative barnase/colicin E5 family endoribonuclease n=1 Tax=Campylobacter jejuni TaxID=197 RepID=UPI002FBE1201|nr:DUF3519 domain-containing protein [Campylobacter jejuni]
MEKGKIILKKFRDEKGFYTLLITEENGKRLITFLPKTREDFIRNKIDNASLIQSFTSRASKQGNGLANESITQPLFKSKEAREFLELVEGFDKLYKNDAIIAKNFTQGTASKLSTSIATSAEGAIKQKVVKGGFDPIFRLLPDGVLFGLFSKQIQGGALRYHLKKALSRSLNYDDFKLKLERELKRTNFNSNTSRLIEKLMQNLEDFNAEKEAKLAQIREAKREEELKEDFGINFEGFKGKEAVLKLLEEKGGQVKGAFYKEGLGEIDLVWGDDSFGLKHILNKHGGEFENLARELSEAVENGKIVKDDKGRLRLEYENKIVGIKDNWKGEKTNHWVVTAYVKKEKEASLYASTSFTKGEALPLNSKESIAQKALNLHEKLYLKDNDSPLKVEYKIVNKDALKPSFTLSKTQFRSQKQEDLIAKIKNNFNPDLLVSIRGDLKKGNPIITQEGEVLSGNHRVEALKELRGENLSKYQKAVKEAFGVELKENEMLVRVVSEDTSEAQIKRFSAASNEGLENNLGEQGVSLFAKYQDKIKALKETKHPFIAEDVYNLKYLVNKALGESSITKENDTSKALFASLARGRNNTILKALNELEKENLEQVSKTANMFFDNAGAFYNLTHDLEMPKMQNLQNYFSDVLVSAAKADDTRAEDFTKLNEDIRAFLDSSDKEAMLKLSPNLVSDLLTKALGAGFARFARLENPSANLFEFLKGLKQDLLEKGAPDLFSGGKGVELKKRDEFDFAKELILKGQDSEAKFKLYGNLEELKAWGKKQSVKLEPAPLNVTALNKEAREQWLETFNLKSLDEEAIVEIPVDLKERLGKEIKLNKKDFEKLVKNKREKYIPQIKETFKEPEAVFIDENKDLIFAKSFNDKLFFVNVNRDYGEAFKALSLAPKKNNNLLNKLDKAKEILKLDSKLRDYTAQQAFTGVLSASNKPSSESIAQNALIITKESLDKDLNKNYTLELELTPRFSDEVRPTDTKSNTGGFNSQEHMADENIATIAKTDEESIAQKAWLEAFGLKSMQEAYTPKFSKEVNEALEKVLNGEQIKLTKGSYEKLLKRDREEFLPFIKETLENADAVLKDKENALIFVKDIGKKSYFTSVAKNANNEWVISTNSLKTLNTLKNRLNDNGELLYLSKEASNILAEAFTKRAFSNELASESIAQNSEKLPFEMQVLAEDKLSGDEVRHLANKIGEKSTMAYFKDYLLKMDRDFHARAKDIIREYYKIEPFRKELENQWANVKEAYKNGEMSLKEFKFLSKYKDEKSFLNQVAGVLWHHNDELVKNRGHTINKYGQIEEGKANYYQNLALEYDGALKTLKKWFYYIQKANKQAQRFFNKKELEEFGVNFEGFKGKEAVLKLLEEKRGQVKGAFYKEGLGEIDLVWGGGNHGLRKAQRLWFSTHFG